MTTRQLSRAKPSIKHHPADDPYILEENLEQPQKVMEFPTTRLGKFSSTKDSLNNLHIHPFSHSNLPERYESSEEEASPSPDSENESQNSETTHLEPGSYKDEANEHMLFEEYKAEVATAMPIFAGRPKLVDITNLAPMHKRKRVERPILPRSTTRISARLISTNDDDKPPLPNNTVSNISAVKQQFRDQDYPSNLVSDRPNSWLPDENFKFQKGQRPIEEKVDQYFPDLELRNPPTYNDYDPYSLNPPKLSPKNSYNSGKKPGSVARARGKTIPPRSQENGWKGLSRTMSVARKQGSTRSGETQGNQKPKMIARGAAERESMPFIPAFTDSID